MAGKCVIPVFEAGDFSHCERQMIHQAWECCQSWLKTGEGMPGEIYVVDIPDENLEALVSLFHSDTGDSFDELLTGSNARRSSTIVESVQRLIHNEIVQLSLSESIDELPLHMYIERWSSEMFSLEIVFWPDLLLKTSSDTRELQLKFEKIVLLALRMVERAGARLLLITEGTGDPLDLEPVDYYFKYYPTAAPQVF